MSETKRTQHFRSMEGEPYQLGPLKMAFKRIEGDTEGSYSLIESIEPPGASTPAGVFEAFVIDVSAANSDREIDVRAVFERHGCELLT